MGSTMEAFCCSNEKTEETIDKLSIQDSTNTALKSSIIGQNKLPSNDIMPLFNLNKILEFKSSDEPHPFEDFVIIEFLGKGEYSEVYLVKNKKNNEVFVLKKIKRNKEVNEEDIEKELEKYKQLNHAYINNIYEYYIKDKYIFILEEFCSEGNLLDKIHKGKMFPEFIVKIIMFEIFKALIYLNSKNITHGNLKLQNILLESNDIKADKKTNKKSIDYNEDKFINAINKDMLLLYKNIPNFVGNYKFDFKDEDSITKLNKKINETQKRSESAQTGLRFGLSKKTEDKLKAIPNLKYKGENNIYNSGKFEFLKYGIKLNDFFNEKICSRNKLTTDSILYFSPETISENKIETCDIWSCGIIMYFLLSGSFPFRGNDIEEIKSKIISGKFIFDFDIFTGISEDAKDLIKKCLKNDKELRIKLIDTVKHPFFDDLKDSKVYLIDEKKILENLKNQKERPIFYQMVLNFISYHFKDTELLIELSRIFYKIDRNSDGKITKDDLIFAYEEAGEKINKKDLDEIIKNIDFDRNGFIEYDEFIRVCIPEDRLFTENNLKDAFELFDKNQSGNISYLNVVEALESEDRINPKMVELLKIEVAKMGNDNLNFEKFKNLMIKLSLQ
jgi:serine/threonine protein kinase